MANMKSPKDQLAMMALKEAADDADTQASNMDTDTDMDQMLKCPKCGHQGKEHEFLLPAGQSSKFSPENVTDSENTQDY